MKALALNRMAQVSVSRLVKWALFAVLLTLPFQRFPQTFFDLKDGSLAAEIPISSFKVSYIIAVFVMLTFFVMRPDIYRWKKLPITKFIVLFLAGAVVSLIANKVAPAQGAFGIYDVLKNVIIIYPFALLNFSRDEFLWILKKLRTVAIILAAAGIAGEVMALSFKVGIGYLTAWDSASSDAKRMGFYRIESLMGRGNWNQLGIYLSFLLFLTAPFSRKGAKGLSSTLAILTAVFLTMSRQAWVDLGALALMLKKKFVVVGAFFVILAAITILQAPSEEFDTASYFRGFAFIESIAILLEKPLLGAGPGMFGGPVSVKFSSPYYDSWPVYFKEMLDQIRHIDSYWPWLWAEFGLIGLSAYIAIGVSLFLFLKKAARFYGEGDRFGYFGNVLRYFLLIIFIMGFTMGLTSSITVYTYFALVGMYISIYFKDSLILGRRE